MVGISGGGGGSIDCLSPDTFFSQKNYHRIENNDPPLNNDPPSKLADFLGVNNAPPPIFKSEILAVNNAPPGGSGGWLRSDVKMGAWNGFGTALASERGRGTDLAALWRQKGGVEVCITSDWHFPPPKIWS